MSRVIHNYKPRKTKGGRRDTYPWDKWFNGQTHELTQGKTLDFVCKPTIMRIHIYRMAKRRGVRVSVHMQPPNSLVITPFVPPKLRETVVVPKTPAPKKPSSNPFKDATPSKTVNLKPVAKRTSKLSRRPPTPPGLPLDKPPRKNPSRKKPQPQRGAADNSSAFPANNDLGV